MTWPGKRFDSDHLIAAERLLFRLLIGPLVRYAQDLLISIANDENVFAKLEPRRLSRLRFVPCVAIGWRRDSATLNARMQRNNSPGR